jgi:hypothetical protein
MSDQDGRRAAPHPRGQVPPGWLAPGPAPLPPQPRAAPPGFLGGALALAVVALSVGALGVVVGVFCVGFIFVFGAPPEVLQAAMAGFAFWGTVVTAPFFLAAVAVVVVGAARRGWSTWCIAPLVVDAVTLVGLVVAVLCWFHPGVHVSSDFSS